MLFAACCLIGVGCYVLCACAVVWCLLFDGWLLYLMNVVRLCVACCVVFVVCCILIVVRCFLIVVCCLICLLSATWLIVETCLLLARCPVCCLLYIVCLLWFVSSCAFVIDC